MQRQLGAFDDALEHAAGVDRLELDGAAVVEVAVTSDAAGRSARIATPPFCGCAPSTPWGLKCSRRTQRLEFAARHCTHSLSSRRLIPATGIETQSGRLSSS